MQTRTLGKDLSVSAVGLGCMGFSHAYGAPMDTNETVRLLQQAVEMGYTFFDTAEVYGTPDNPHVNEQLLGKALAPVRDKVVIATKFGLRFDFESGKVPLPLIPDARPQTIRQSVEDSLRRLRTDHIDLYFQHRIDPKVEPEQVSSAYLAYLQRLGISYLFAGKDKMDGAVLLEKLGTQFGIDRMMIAGGGVVNWSFLQEGLIDELSLVIAPVADGSTTAVSCFEWADFLPPHAPIALQIKNVDILQENVLWLRYKMA